MEAYIVSEELDMTGKPLDLVEVLEIAAVYGKEHNSGIYFVEGDGSERFQTYFELWENAKKLLYGLNQLGLKKGDKIIFQLKNEFRFINLFWACLMGGIIPVPLSVALSSEKTEAFTKLVNVQEQLGNPLIVTESTLRRAFDTRLLDNNNLSIINFEEIQSLSVKQAEIISPSPNALAFIQFSSGSTGNPRGVMLTHTNLVNNIFQISAGAKINNQDFAASWLPLTHDMGLILFHLTFVGTKSNQLKMSPETFIKNPALFLEKITKYRATYFGCPNFALAWILEKVTDKELEGIDLSSVRVLFNGAEPISMSIVRKFIAKFAKYNFNANTMFLAYGMAEACVGACFPPVGSLPLSHKFDRRLFTEQQEVKEANVVDMDYIEFADVGYPLPGMAIKILDDRDQLVNESVVGNIVIKGPNVTSGYYNHSDVNQDLFVDGFLKTGDLGMIRNKRLIITGRKKDIIFYNGQNFYAHDIERICMEIDGLSTDKIAVCGTFDEITGKDEMLIFIQFRKKLEQFLKIHLAVKELITGKTGQQVDYVIPVKSIPRTTSGKIQRYKLEQQYRNRDFELVIRELQKLQTLEQTVENGLPRNEIDSYLIKLWSETLKQEQIGIYNDFFALGGDSLRLIQIISDLSVRYNLDIAVDDFRKLGHIAALSDYIAVHRDSVKQTKYPAKQGDPDHTGEVFPLTEVQMAYLMGRNNQFEMGGVSTHGYYEIETGLDLNRLSGSLQRVIRRQPMLRAVVYPTGEQKIFAQVPDYEIKVEDISDLTQNEQRQRILAERERMSHAVFQTNQWPLFEFKAFKTAPDIHYLFVGFDLLIADGTSMRILIKEMMDFYKNPQLEPAEPEFNFRDYILACREFKQTETYRQDKTYWLNKLADFPQSPSLPLKKAPQDLKSPRFKRHQRIYSQTEWEELKKKAQEHNITASGLLCMAYAQVLAYWSNQPRLAINVTLFNRYPFHPDVNKIIGDFTSVMLLDIRMDPSLSFWEQAEKIQNELMEALEHRHYDGVEFIREISKYHNLGTKAVMPVVFTSMLFAIEDEGRGGTLEDFGEIQTGISQTSQVYLDFQASENQGALTVTWDYVEDLFDKNIINTMFAQYTAILDRILENTTITDSSGFVQTAAAMEVESLLFRDRSLLYLMKQSEEVANYLEAQHKMLVQYNRTEAEITPTTLQQLFREQAGCHPGRVAVVYEGRPLTYGELDEQSNRLARYLQEQGIGRNDLVGVLAYRDLRTLVNVMGILKAGAAYVPLDPEYPEERKKYIVENSNCKRILEPEFYEQNLISEYSSAPMENNHYPEDIAYIIYTSGSTGRPKGVVITHEAVTNTICDMNRRFKVTGEDRIIGLSSMCFDLSVYDIFGAFASGATLVLIPDVRDVKHLQEIIDSEKITIWNSVPAIMEMLLDNMPEAEETDFWMMDENSQINVSLEESSLRLVLLSGDWIPVSLPDRIRKEYENAEVISLGGATEVSIWSIYYPVEEVNPEWKSIPYGKPLANQTYYVLNYENDY